MSKSALGGNPGSPEGGGRGESDKTGEERLGVGHGCPDGRSGRPEIVRGGCVGGYTINFGERSIGG